MKINSFNSIDIFFKIFAWIVFSIAIFLYFLVWAVLFNGLFNCDGELFAFSIVGTILDLFVSLALICSYYEYK